MRLYSTGYLTFGVKVDYGLKEFLEGGALHAFDKENGSDIGYLTAGSFEDQSLYLVTYCESVTPHEEKVVGPRDFPRKDRTVWKRQIEKFLRQYDITPMGTVGLRLLADLDN